MKHGFIAISSVLIIAAVSLSILITVSVLSIGEGQSGLALTNGEMTLNLTESCVEDALLSIRSNPSYAGGTINMPEGTCSITISQAGNVYTITSTGTFGKYKRTIQAVVTRGSALSLSSWKEI